MASPGVLLMLTPHSSAGFYARNNPFQQAGPVGFVEQKALPNNEVYVRIDLPGVQEDHLTHVVDKDKKLVLVVARAPRSQYEDAGRLYSTAFGLPCDCCEISGVVAQLRDGVLRILLKKARMEKDNSKPAASICDHHLPVVFKGSPPGPSSGDSEMSSEENPYVLEGSKKPFETKGTEGGGLFVRVDMPGMRDEDLGVFMEKGEEVRFMGRTTTCKLRGGALDTHDSGPRKYLGAVCPFPPIKRIRGDVACEVQHGVLRMIIPAPS